MSIRLRDLIKAVRACKTAQEEREVIAKEAAELRAAFREQSETVFRHRNVAKLMYMHMLGYPTHFGQMEALKLIASPGLGQKRLGYLGLSVLLDERAEVLMLVTNSLKADLGSRDPGIVGVALTALAAVGSAAMLRDLAPEVARLTGCPTSAAVRKKAAACGARAVARCPDLAELFADRPAALLSTDRTHGVLLAAAALGSAVVGADPAAAAALATSLPGPLTRLVRSLAAAGGGASPDHDVGGVCDPWLQVAALRLLRELGGTGRLAPPDADAVADALTAVATATPDPSRGGPGATAAAAVLLEAVRTALAPGIAGGSGGPAEDASSASASGLRALAVSILGRFLASRDGNLRYVALDALAAVAATDPASVQRHRATVVACVRDGDASIRRRALALVCALVTPANVVPLARELTDYLGSAADPAFRPELAARLAGLAARHAPDARWRFDALVAVMRAPGAAVHPAVARGLLVMVSNCPDLQPYAARALLAELRGGGGGGSGGDAGPPLSTAAAAATPLPPQPLLGAAVWAVGEWADLLLASPPPGLLPGEAAPDPASLTPAAIAAALERVAAALPAAACPLAPPALPAAVLIPDGPAGPTLAAPGPKPRPDGLVDPRALALTALAKLAARAGATDPVARRVAEGEALLARDADPEVQARAVEYGALLGGGPGGEGAGSPADPLAALAAPAGPAAAVGLAAAVLERIPPLDLGAYARASAGLVSAGEEGGAGADATAALAAAGGGRAAATAPAAAADAMPDLLGDLLALDDGAATAAAIAAPPPGEGGAGGGAAADPFAGLAAPVSAAVGVSLPAGGAGGVPPPLPADLFAPMPAVEEVPAAATPAPPAPVAAAAVGDTAVAPAAPEAPPAAAAAAAAAAASPLTHTATPALRPGSPLAVTLAFTKPGGAASPETAVAASLSLAGPAALAAVSLQAAVPKFARLALSPASGAALAPGDPPISQAMTITSTAPPGAKPLAVRLRLAYTLAGSAEEVVEMVEVGDLPPGF